MRVRGGTAGRRGAAVEGWIARGWAAAFSCSEESEGRPEGCGWCSGPLLAL